MKFKKVILCIILVFIIVGVIFLITQIKTKKSKDSNKISVVVTNFSTYDFLRAIIGDTEDVELTFLLGAGKETHSYDPTAQDLVTIQNADLFVYIGGNMENWSGRVLESLDNKNQKIICISNDVQKIPESEIDGAEEEHEHDHEEELNAFDEHIWTSPANAIAMVNSLETAMEELNPKQKEKYKQNAQNYIKQIQEVDNQMQEILANKVRNRLVFGDKMPMQYFINYYNLDVSAAFNGCSTETEPSSKTIAYLVDKVRNENIPVVLYIELNTGKVAKIIADDAGNGAKTMQIQTLHNISKKDFDAGETWVSLMKRNLEVIKAALQ